MYRVINKSLKVNEKLHVLMKDSILLQKETNGTANTHVLSDRNNSKLNEDCS